MLIGRSSLTVPLAGSVVHCSCCSSISVFHLYTIMYACVHHRRSESFRFTYLGLGEKRRFFMQLFLLIFFSWLSRMKTWFCVKLCEIEVTEKYYFTYREFVLLFPKEKIKNKNLYQEMNKNSKRLHAKLTLNVFKEETQWSLTHLNSIFFFCMGVLSGALMIYRRARGVDHSYFSQPLPFTHKLLFCTYASTMSHFFNSSACSH